MIKCVQTAGTCSVVDDVGGVNDHAVRLNGAHTRGAAMLAWHIFDASAHPAVDVMVVVEVLNFESGGGPKLKFPHQPDIHQGLHHGIDGLNCDRRKLLANQF